jgi:hypothetical protein
VVSDYKKGKEEKKKQTEEKITSSTPSHILSWCEEAFKKGYKE